jgi:hypothetical protein
VAVEQVHVGRKRKSRPMVAEPNAGPARWDHCVGSIPTVSMLIARLPWCRIAAMSRLGGILAFGCIWLVLGVPPAGAAQSPDIPPSRAARTLANIIRRDAGQQYRRSKAAVTVTNRCCGVRVLRVHYRAKATGDITTDAYVLKLETRRGILQGVAISESATEAKYKPQTGSWKGGWKQEFAIYHASHGPHGPNRGWSFTDFWADTSETNEVVDGKEIHWGVGGSQMCAPRAPLSRALYQEVLVMLESAKRHVTSGLRQPSTYC